MLLSSICMWFLFVMLLSRVATESSLYTATNWILLCAVCNEGHFHDIGKVSQGKIKPTRKQNLSLLPDIKHSYWGGRKQYISFSEEIILSLIWQLRMPCQGLKVTSMFLALVVAICSAEWWHFSSFHPEHWLRRRSPVFSMIGGKRQMCLQWKEELKWFDITMEIKSWGKKTLFNAQTYSK